MTWTAFHRRADVLRAVIDEADLRRDGHLPTHLPGVTETFHDELDLVGALQLRWYTRLAGAVERTLSSRALDPEAAVRDAWLATAEALPGIRVVLDRYADQPTSPAMAEALRTAHAKEHVLLAVMSGRADGGAEGAGRRIEEAARASYLPGARIPARPQPAGSATFVARLKAALAA
jgi:hypothetical protein